MLGDLTDADITSTVSELIPGNANMKQFATNLYMSGRFCGKSAGFGGLSSDLRGFEMNFHGDRLTAASCHSSHKRSGFPRSIHVFVRAPN